MSRTLLSTDKQVVVSPDLVVEYYFFMDPDGTWVMNEYVDSCWEKSIIGVNERWC